MSNAAFRMLGWGLELAGLLLLVTGCVLAWGHWRRHRGWRTALGTVVDQAVRAPTPGNPYAFPVVECTPTTAASIAASQIPAARRDRWRQARG
ncbi:MAG: hypothetical protein FAZ92_02338 [Accumulibacter sp.]|uniref:hypothetical protein n=1 Tax=Accumulibacter sp. TaxID=2053492 RepID=UPI00122AB3D4|nr:hypothetical protein [Accumulibacter sp.]QKS27972.1 MAG: hypothetical protein HT579_02800 [Candidatus Accumulibacter similis]TLD45384.1 MAG: hypothetical protein FAZ92_02338 [Accumulibacter sp.]